ncbi:MAG TPA: hypothetical protein VGO07_03365 [Candidatus Saccharimonadales bacterium]|jgi:hypothetical protein|nr:hypothetical protein [Candidatus Saccharimonadales bacterium]
MVFALIAAVVVGAQLITVIQPYFVAHTYALGKSETLLQAKDTFLGSKLVHDAKKRSFNFNDNYNPTSTDADTSGGPKVKAIINEDPASGIEVTDPISSVSVKIKPKFGLLEGKQDANRVVYPLTDGTGWLVYTMQATGVKEDVVLDHANGDTMKLDYDMDLDSQGLSARLQSDGSVGVYGSSLPISSSTSTGSDKDAALLQKALQHAKKDKYLFSLPTPVVYQAGHTVSSAKTHFELKGNVLTSVTTGLKKAMFPLTVDPAVTVISTSDLFRDTNQESNIDFNATTGNISRGVVTGGVVTTSWTTNGNNLGTARFLNGATIYDDYAYVAGGAAAGSTSNISTVEYAAVSKVNSSIGSWATTTVLPAALSRFQLIAYNGYMYAIGGSTTDTTCAGVSSSIYYNRIQTNGQLSANWTTNTATLPAGVCGLGAAVYNDVLYIAGGRTGSLTSNGSTTVAYASINPDGSIGTFTSDDSVLPAARYDADLKIYNGYAYVIGGTLAGTATNTVLEGPLASDGSLYGGAGTATWDTTSPMITARTAMGGTLAAMNDGYMYVEGGCNTLNASQTCTATGNIQSDIEVAQINADGTLGAWSSIATTIASRQQVGGSLQFWRGAIYVFAGCSVMSTSAVQCTTALNTQVYDSIATPGQLGPLHTATSLNTGIYEFGSVVVGGYIYVIGGCKSVDTGTTNGCQNGGGVDTSNVTSYALISADGSLGSWTDSTFTLNGVTGLAAFGVATYNGYIYLTGGYANGTGATNKTWIAQTNATGGNIKANWTNTGMGTLGVSKYSMSAVVYHGYLFTFGGCSATTTTFGCASGNYAANTFSGQIAAATGLIATFNAQTAMPTATAAMGGAVYNGYVYLAGGATQANAQTTTVLYAKLGTAGTIVNWLGPLGTTANATLGTAGVMPNPLRRANAYAMNGYFYVLGGHNAAGNGGAGQTYGTIDIGQIDLSTGNIAANLTSSVIQITPRWDPGSVFSNGRIYIAGGCTNGNPPTSCATSGALGASKVVEYVEIYNAGNKGTSAWTNATNVYTTNRTDAASVAYNGYVYIAGGCSAYTVATSVCATAGNYLNTVYYAPLNPDGSIGAWASGGTLGASIMDGCVVGVGGYLYFMGGKDSTGTTVATVYYSQIGASGLPGAWNTTTVLPTALSSLSCDTFDGHIYTTGGANAGGAAQSLVYYSPDQSAGGTIASWTPTTGFTTGRYNHSTVIVAGYLFVIGGNTGSAFLQDVQSVQLSPTTGAATGSWGFGTDLPNPVQQANVIAANGYIYLSGGRSATATCSATTWIASVNSTGTTSDWSQGANTFSTARFGAGGAFFNGYYYVLGGDDCTNVISSNVIPYGGEQSQAMKASFSKYADLNGDGTPQKLVIYLTNAVNNGVDIELWRLTYKSSREAANSWGVTTVVSPLVNEHAYSVSALDGSAVDQILARWFFLSFDINMEQSFSFTDANQPTIFQYGLHYSSPTAKRLMHGRDFRDQTQQGLDLKL